MTRLTYEEILTEAKGVDAAQQMRLVEELAATMRRSLSPGERRSVLELQGLGKDIWQRADAQRYIDGERSSWGG